jgi:hypothetical protein
MLCAHTLECALKAYLSRSGPEVEKEIRNDQQLRHNLTALWERASDEGLPIPKTLPSWASRLSELHNRPFHLRYLEGVHGIVTPPAEPMATELSDLVGAVREVI